MVNSNKIQLINKSNTKTNKKLCRKYYYGNCKYGEKCKFYHPEIITPPIKSEIDRKSQHCYCGNKLKTIIKYSKEEEGDDTNSFFIICAKTGKSMRKCM